MDDLRPFDLLPDELLHLIMLRCGPTQLSRCELVCRRWRTCITPGGDSVWLRMTERLWRSTGWVHNVPRVCPLTERLRKVPVGAMRRTLIRYDTAGLTERSEWMRLLRVALLWGHSACTLCDRGWSAPGWALNINDCKAAYMFATLEVARKVPLECELTRQNWHLFYIHSGALERFDIQFFDNKQMTASSHPGATFRWSMQDGSSSRRGEPGLQIENFPLHTFARRADGLWSICNAHVVIEQGVPPPDMLPLFDAVP
jgi:hypothetical protein